MERAVLLLFLVFIAVGVWFRTADAQTPQWIWCRGEERPRNFRLNVRKLFSLPQDQVVRARLRISADSRYRLYLNGEWLGDGPSRSFPQHQQFDEYEVTGQLQGGDNILAATVHHYGESTFHYLIGRGGLFFDLLIDLKDGTQRHVVSDKTCRVSPFAAYAIQTPRISCQMPFEEQYDSRRFAADWMQLSFSDQDWQPAEEIGPEGTAPWTGMQPRTIPFLSRVPVYPVRMVSSRFVQPATLVETVQVKRALLPGDFTSNHNQYRGAVATIIKSPVAQKATLVRQWSLYVGDWYLNGEVVKQPRKNSVEVQLRQGDNLFVADLVGQNHFIDFTLALDAAQPLHLQAPLQGKGKWAIIGPLDQDIKKAKEQVKKLLTVAGLGKYKGPIHFSGQGDAEAADDIWNRLYSQNTVAGQPRIENPSGLMADNGNWTVIPPQPHDVEVLLDFGQELVGFTEFEIDAPAGAVLDVHCFEAINDGVIQETYGNRSSFRYIARAGRQHFVTDWRRGFRYTAMTVRGLTAPLKIRYLRTLMSTYPAVERGRFQCSDEKLNKIWTVGRHTLLCCMEDTFTDCPTYEQTYWVGDGRNEALICHAAYGEWPLVERCVKVVPQSLYRSPLPESQVPSGWQNILTAWSLLWIQMAHEYWWYSGDRATLAEVYDGVAQTLRACKSYCQNQYGLMSISAWNMFDWAGTDTGQDLVTHNNLFLVEALARAESMAGALAKPQDVQEWQTFRTDLTRAINTHLWSDALNGYIDSIHRDGTPSKTVSQQTNTLALLYHVAPAERAARIAGYTTTPPPGMVQFGSPFAMFYLLEELAQSSHFDQLLAVIRDRWGFMIDAGATSFWETFPGFEKDIPTRSHCHAWSAAPTYFLSRYQLGVSPLQPGYSRTLIAPQPVDLTWAKGSMPTPQGEVEVAWQKRASAFDLTVSLPPGIKAQVVLPVKAQEFATLSVNGQSDRSLWPPAVTSVRQDNGQWLVELDAAAGLTLSAKK